MGLDLNARASELCRLLLDEQAALRVAARTSASGARIIDCGIEVPGGLEAGRRLAEICLAGLGRVQFVPSQLTESVAVMVAIDQPVAACMASQYAGWKISGEKFFAMGSGPMRAAAGQETLFAKIGLQERSDTAVGVLETRQFPPDDVCQKLAQNCGVAPDRLTLLVAPTASLAGMVQVVARSVETALHKLFELQFDLGRIVSGWGIAPLPPVAKNDLKAIGRTNDAILYGAEVTLWVRGDDASLEAIGPRVPSCASADFGRPFAEIFAKYDHDFYKIDPLLFSPAAVTLANLETGRSYRFGAPQVNVIRESFDVRSSDT